MMVVESWLGFGTAVGIVALRELIAGDASSIL